MMTGNKENRDILDEVLRGKRSHGDPLFVEWLEQSQENRERYEAALTEVAREIRTAKEFDVAKVWRGVNREIRRREHPLRIKMRQWMKYAAVLIPLLVAGMWLLYTTRSAMTEIEVGVNTENITLVLSNGETINVHRFDSAGLTEQNGMHIAGKARELVYKPTASATGELIYNILCVPMRAEYCLTLSDGTKIWLAATSRLKYPVDFVGNRREVYLEGEAFFKVAKHAEKPFVVNGKDFSVTALGTSFDVSCYPDDDYASATLASGKIEVCLDGEKRILHPGQQAIIRDDIVVKEVNILPYTSWMDDRLYFFNEELEVIMKRMARWYGMEVIYADPDVRKLHFTGNIPKYTDIKKVFELLQLTTHLDFDFRDGKIVISRGKE